MRVSVIPPASVGGITGIGVSEVAAALEHELSQGGVPRRNGPGETSVRFKNVNDLASELKVA
jgi:DNA replication protein DnaC